MVTLKLSGRFYASKALVATNTGLLKSEFVNVGYYLWAVLGIQIWVMEQLSKLYEKAIEIAEASIAKNRTSETEISQPSRIRSILRIAVLQTMEGKVFLGVWSSSVTVFEKSILKYLQ